MFKGYKTYITGSLAILVAVGSFAAGDANIADTIQLVVTAVLGMTLRIGIAETK